MMPQWDWIALGALGALTLVVIYQQVRIYQIHQNSKKREEMFKIVTENAADMIALVDVKGHRLYNSPAYKRILGYTAAELSETSSFEQIHPDDRFKVLEAAREARSTGVGRKLDYRVRHKDGTWRVLESIASAIRNDKGEVSKLVIVNRDVTERKRAEEQLEHNSFHDALTGLPNRRLFLDRLGHMFARAQKSRAAICRPVRGPGWFQGVQRHHESNDRRPGDYRDGQSAGSLSERSGHSFPASRQRAFEDRGALQDGRRRVHHPAGRSERSE